METTILVAFVAVGGTLAGHLVQFWLDRVKRGEELFKEQRRIVYGRLLTAFTNLELEQLDSPVGELREYQTKMAMSLLQDLQEASLLSGVELAAKLDVAIDCLVDNNWNDKTSKSREEFVKDIRVLMKKELGTNPSNSFHFLRKFVEKRN